MGSAMEGANKLELKEFEKFLKICRKYGVLEVDSNGIKAKFNEKLEIRPHSDPGEIETEELTPEQLMFYAVGQGQSL